MDDKQKHAGGRPTKYDPAMCETAIKILTETAAERNELAYELGCGRTTLYRWMEEHEEFRHAIQYGEEMACGLMHKIGRVALFSNADNFNVKLYDLKMRNRGYWENTTYKDVRMTKDITIDKVVELTQKLEIKIGEY